MSTPKWMADMRAKAEAARDMEAKATLDTWQLAIDSKAGLAVAATPQTVLWLLDMLEATARYSDGAAEEYQMPGGNRHPWGYRDRAKYEAGPGCDAETFAELCRAATESPMLPYDEARRLGVVKSRKEYDTLAKLRVGLHGPGAGPGGYT